MYGLEKGYDFYSVHTVQLSFLYAVCVLNTIFALFTGRFPILTISIFHGSMEKESGMVWPRLHLH
jgi:hypothetical protein